VVLLSPERSRGEQSKPVPLLSQAAAGSAKAVGALQGAGEAISYNLNI